jgi:acyl-CoA synthetase (AMP-forming)/AMP-acid ligase II
MVHVPIHHLGSVGNCGSTALILGAAQVFMDNFSPRAGLELISRERITIFAQVPTMFLMQMAIPEWETADLSSVQIIFFAGSVMPAEGVQRLARLGVPMLTGYGLTETSGPVTLSLPDVPLEDLSATIGSPCEGVELKIGDDAGDALPDGSEGEIMVRGDCIFAGYFNDEAATRAAIDPDGWFRTGDLAIMSGGRIVISGRKQDAFKSGGVNIYPREIEEVLQDHPSVAIACVVSVPDDVYQEVGVAYLVPRDGQRIEEADLRRHCAERLTKYKIPRRFEVRDELPVIGIGKVDNVRLRLEARGR